MYLEVKQCLNWKGNISQMYHVISEFKPITFIECEKDGKEVLASIIGWDAEKETPCPAYACRIEESGDGVALLIFGGNGGIRMKAADDTSEWDVNNLEQWSESHLIYPKNSFVKYMN